ncbi:Biopolymer transport protein ExbD/TolR [Poriferisphaera corsica]|uniref:Biopolymer transport protein ExbD/TolR n=1 Tax=Poriferisphaera corsica TaxID=2528020 RepID=A0A517YRP9_9BACT|nr:biopolymer transporter ExbD [Poriferisphaera corsica]QDU32898.1 Biopolymer transport protein ExbD/TolR [Poriferisphaera corsica]
MSTDEGQQNSEQFMAQGCAVDDEYVPVRKRRLLPPAKMQLQITSLIDVIFQLLIYFIVTASFVMGEGALPANLPHGGDQATSEAAHPEQPLNIVLTPVGNSSVRIEVEGFRKPTESFVQLQSYLTMLQYNPKKKRSGFYKPSNPVIIKPVGQVRWQHVLNAFNSAVSIGYENVSFARVERFVE